MTHAEPQPGTVDRAGRGWRQRIPRLLLLLGLLLAAAQFLPSLPHEQTLVFRVDDAKTIRRLDATWTRVGDTEPRGGLTLHFPGGAERLVERHFSAPNGRYTVAVHLERQTSTAGASPKRTRTSYIRRVHLDGSETIIALEDDR